MSNPITDARLKLAEALGELGYRVYPTGTENPNPPCIQIFARDDWMINPRLQGRSRDLRLQLRLSVASIAGSEQGMAQLEQMVWDVTGVITEREAIGAPRLETGSSIECYVVDLVTIVRT